MGYHILIDVSFTGWDAHCAGLDKARRREAEWKEKEQVWASAPTDSTSDGWGVNEGDDRWVSSDEQLFNAFYAIYRGTWPSVEGACIPCLVYLLPYPYPWPVVPSPLGCSICSVFGGGNGVCAGA
jgi:hypothetical protein